MTVTATINAIGRVVGRVVELSIYAVGVLFFYLTITHFIYEVRTGDWQPDPPPTTHVPGCPDR